MNGINLPVIHPAFQNLRKNRRFLHFIAALIILVHAISHISRPGSNNIYSICLLLIALDIFLLVFVNNHALNSVPKLNLFFRVIECLFFLGISVEMFSSMQWFIATLHLLIGAVYLCLFYCERNLEKNEIVGIYHSGLIVPALSGNKFLLWSNVTNIEANYSKICINTPEKSLEFNLKTNLQFGELDQIHEFCRHYLGSAK